MSTMNISLPEAFRTFVELRVALGGHGTSSEYVREIICKDGDRTRLRDLLLAGAQSPPSVTVDESYFKILRQHVHHSSWPPSL